MPPRFCAIRGAPPASRGRRPVVLSLPRAGGVRSGRPLASSPRNVRPRCSPANDRSSHPDATMIPRWITIAYLAYLVAPIVLLFVGSLGELWLNTLLPTGATLK